MSAEIDKTTIPGWLYLRDLIKDRTKTRYKQPVICASGEPAQVYLDLKSLFTTGTRMSGLATAMLFYYHRVLKLPPLDAVGGPTMGADFVSHAICGSDYDVEWFSVRDKPKDHGLQRLIEGVQPRDNWRVLLVDDVVSTGKSLLKAFDAIEATGAHVAAVMPIVDRRGTAWKGFWFEGVPYHPLFTHEELGLDPP